MTGVDADDDDPFVIGLFRHGDGEGIGDLSVTVRGQTIRMSDEDGRRLLDSLESWYYPFGRDADVRPWQFEDASPQAQQRGTDSANAVFEQAGLDRDEPGMEEAYLSVQNWFAKNDGAIQASERGEDDGCPCESCREQHGPLPEQG